MDKVIVFAGTTEGYELSRFLAAHEVSVLSCVATEYGKKSLTENTYLKVRAGRLNQEEMEGLLASEKPSLVLDATHPYAADVTGNIRAACEKTGVSYQRVLRSESAHEERAVYVDSVDAAAEFLTSTEGNVLVTTGSKELKKFMSVKDYGQRIFARVLSLPSVMAECSACGFEGKHLIGMQGPFSTEMNAAMLRQFDCRYLVTKDSGKAGGFQEKLEAARLCGVTPVIIGRPLKEEGWSLTDSKGFLAERFGFTLKSHVTLLGIGMGSEGTLTLDGKKALEKADLLIGAKRIADAVKMPHHTVIYEYKSEEILTFIQEHPEYERVVVALSGDVGFYSGARKLLEGLEKEGLGKQADIICGISSVAYFMAKAGLSWDDAKLASAHGKACNLVSLIRQNKKVFSILGTSDGIGELAKKLVYYGMGEIVLHVGERLSYEDERYFAKKAEELTDYCGDALCVVCACNENAVPLLATHGISDEAFIRGKAPMTKEEIRCVSLFKLGLYEDSICYDVGAGTGSVSVEMALRAHQGRVYAIEKKEDALALLAENKKKFAADNLEIVAGTAPDAMEELPAPTHAFIGGSSGNLKAIVKLLLDKNEKVHIVINCITLETIAEALAAIKAFELEADIVQLSAARSREIGVYHLMNGENPIYIISCRRKGL